MTLRRATLRPFSLPLVRSLATAHGRISERLGWLVELTDREGRHGFGEATPLPEFGTEDLSTCRRALEDGLASWVRGREDPSQSIGDRSADGAASFRGIDAPCARSAIDSARFDLAARGAERSLAAEVRDRAGRAGIPHSSVAVQALVGGADPASVEESAAAYSGQGFRAFKLKLAVSSELRDLGLDLERVSALRSVIGTSARLRLDANEAWSRAQAAEALVALEPFSIDYVEQPVPRNDLVGLKHLSQEGAISVAADEALLGGGVWACLDARAASILIVKPAAVGGLSDAIALWRRAQQDGLRVVWSSLIEGAVGRAAPLALAAGLSPADEVHGLGTAGLLAADLCAGSEFERLDERGHMRVSTHAGIGFDPVLPCTAESVFDAPNPADSNPSGGGDRFPHERGPVFEVEA